MKRQDFTIIIGIIIIGFILMNMYIKAEMYRIENDTYEEISQIYKSIENNTNLIQLKK